MLGRATFGSDATLTVTRKSSVSEVMPNELDAVAKPKNLQGSFCVGVHHPIAKLARSTETSPLDGTDTDCERRGAPSITCPPYSVVPFSCSWTVGERLLPISISTVSASTAVPTRVRVDPCSISSGESNAAF